MKHDIISKEAKTTENLNNIEKYKTALKKVQFINELKNGLGEDIKKNPRGFKVIRKTWSQRLAIALKKIFTRF